MVLDYGKRQLWPEPWPLPSWPFQQPPQPFSDPEAEKSRLDAFLDLARKAREVDARLGQPDCEDPKKTEWLDLLMKRLDHVEALLRGEAPVIDELSLI
jgi:hypothetical protein